MSPVNAAFAIFRTKLNSKEARTVKYVVDRSGRFTERPHYAPHELDRVFECIVTDFLKERSAAI